MGDAKLSPEPQSAFKLDSVPVVGQTGAEVSQQHPSDVNSDDRAQFHANPEHPSCKKQPFKLPKGTAQVIIKDDQFNCLLDTGSQVTTSVFL